MMLCKYCQVEMMSEYETNPHNSRRYKAFFVCPQCKSVCDGEYEDTKMGKRTFFEKWWNPEEDKKQVKE